MPSTTFFNLPEDKQKHIMDVITDELSKNTYETFNISNVVRRTGIARGSFYQYFKDKDDVFTYFYTYIGKIKFDYFGYLFDPSHDVPLFERFNQIYAKGLQFRIDHPKLVDVARQFLRSPHFIDDPEYQKNIDLAINLYASFIQADIDKKRIKPDIDPKLLGEMLMVIFNHITTDHIIHESMDDDHIKQLVANILNMIDKGVGAHVES